MSKLSGLQKTLSEAFSLPLGAVEAYVKPLRQQKMLTTGPRGLSALNINPRDAARVLIAIAGGSPTHAVERLSLYGSLTATPRPTPNSQADLVLSGLGLTPGVTVEDFLTALLAACQRQDTNRVVEAILLPSGQLRQDIDDLPSYQIRASFGSPNPRVSFAFSHSHLNEHGQFMTLNAELVFMPPEYWTTKRSADFNGDLWQDRGFTHITIDAVARFLTSYEHAVNAFVGGFARGISGIDEDDGNADNA